MASNVKTQQLCSEADQHGYVAVHEGSVWLASRKYMMERQKEFGNAGQDYKSDYSSHPYWLQMTEALPQPITGPADENLLNVLI